MSKWSSLVAAVAVFVGASAGAALLVRHRAPTSSPSEPGSGAQGARSSEPAARLVSSARTAGATTRHTMLVHGGQLLHSSFHTGRIELIDLSTGRLAGELVLEDDPKKTRQVAAGDIAIAGGRLFAVRIFSSEIVVFDLASRERTALVDVGGEGKLCASADGKTLGFASNVANQFLLIDSASLRLRTVPYPAPLVGAATCAFSPDGRTLYVGTQRPLASLLAYDLERGAYVATMPLTKSSLASPFALAFSPDARRLYVGMFQDVDGIVVVDTAQNRVARTMQIAGTGPNVGWADPLALAFSGKRLLAYLRNNATLAVIDPDSMTILHTTPVRGGGQGQPDIAFTDREVIVDADELNWLDLQSVLGGGDAKAR